MQWGRRWCRFVSSLAKSRDLRGAEMSSCAAPSYLAAVTWSNQQCHLDHHRRLGPLQLLELLGSPSRSFVCIVEVVAAPTDAIILMGALSVNSGIRIPGSVAVCYCSPQQHLLAVRVIYNGT